MRSEAVRRKLRRCQIRAAAAEAAVGQSEEGVAPCPCCVEGDRCRREEPTTARPSYVEVVDVEGPRRTGPAPLSRMPSPNSQLGRRSPTVGDVASPSASIALGQCTHRGGRRHARSTGRRNPVVGDVADSIRVNLGSNRKKDFYEIII